MPREIKYALAFILFFFLSGWLWLEMMRGNRALRMLEHRTEKLAAANRHLEAQVCE